MEAAIRRDDGTEVSLVGQGGSGLGRRADRVGGCLLGRASRISVVRQIDGVQADEPSFVNDVEGVVEDLAVDLDGGLGVASRDLPERAAMTNDVVGADVARLGDQEGAFQLGVGLWESKWPVVAVLARVGRLSERFMMRQVVLVLEVVSQAQRE